MASSCPGLQYPVSVYSRFLVLLCSSFFLFLFIYFYQFKCALGEWQDKAQSTTCKACAAGMVSNNERIGCGYCGKGKYREPVSKLDCMDCPIGWHKNTATGGNCLSCNAVGKYCSQTGLHAPQICLAGSSTSGSSAYETCLQCPAGSFSQPGTSCTDCVAGRYTDQTGLSSCKDCKTGMYQSAEGLTYCVPVS